MKECCFWFFPEFHINYSKRQSGNSQPRGEFAHFIGCQFLGIARRLTHGTKYKILQQFDIIGTDDLG